MRRFVPLALLLLAACGKNMVQQARYDSYDPAGLFGDGMAMQPAPDGTLSREGVARMASEQRPAMNRALVKRGRDRFAIYCVPCHGRDGSGDGIVTKRGFPRPPDLHETRLVKASDRHFYAVMTQGHGVMHSFADRVPPRDRWAIAAYVRALQATGQNPIGSEGNTHAVR